MAAEHASSSFCTEKREVSCVWFFRDLIGWRNLLKFVCFQVCRTG